MASGWLKGQIKEVTSGDTVVITASGNYESVPPLAGAVPGEKRVILDGIIAPKIGRRDGSTKDEAFAFESRLNLRKLCIGQSVVFKADGQFGQVYHNNIDLAYHQVKCGLAKVKRNAEEAVVAAQDSAKEKGLGLWGSNEAAAAAGEDSNHKNDGDLVGTTIKATVEQVGNPQVLKVMTPSRNIVTVFLVGVTCPVAYGKSAEGSEPFKPEPFSIKAKVFVEQHVLNREVEVKFEGMDKYNNLYVSVNMEGGGKSLAEQLLSLGLAKIADWSSRMMSPLSASKLRTAEKAAKSQKVNIWYNYVPSADSNHAKLSDEFKGVVYEVVSGDTIGVWLPKQKVEKRIQISSIKAPRMPSKANNNTPDPFALEAKEFLRQRIVGREVKVKMEYTRKIPIGAQGTDKQPQESKVLSFGNVTYEEKDKGVLKEINVAEMLLVRGLAQTVKHRGDEERSAIYEDLIEAESRGMKSRKGVHSGKTTSPPRINDVSIQGSLSKSKQFLPFLQRSGRVHAVVDYVLSGHRFKIYIAKDSLMLAFALSNVRCPGKGDPFSEEALQFARHTCMQRNVDIEVESVDKNGTFVGSLYLPPKAHDFGQMIVAAGLAKAQGYNLSEGSPLMQAQNRAKNAKLKIWHDFEETKEVKQVDKVVEVKVETITLRATTIVNGSLFYAQKADENASTLLDQLSGLSLSESGEGKYMPGELVLCKFTGDGRMYRARVEGSDSAKGTYSVFYIDFGNRENVSGKNICPLSLSMKSAAPLAFACQLAFVKTPTLEEDYGVESAQFLHSLIGTGQLLTGRVEDRYSEVIQGKKAETIVKVTLMDPKTNENIALEMIREGLARVEKRRFYKNQEAVKALKEEEENAKKGRLNMWQYGDVGSDDEEPQSAWKR